MAKVKQNSKPRATKSVSTPAMCSKIEIENQRQHKTAARSSAIGKTSKATKGKKKHISKLAPHHSLAVAFSHSIQQSREHIENEVHANVETAYCDLSQRLTEMGDQFNNLKMQTVHSSDAITQPIREQELDWVSSDGKQSGKTPLGNRMKRLERVVAAEEEGIARQCLEMTKIDAEIHRLALELVGQEGYDSLMAGNFDKTTWISNEQRVIRAEIEDENEIFLEQMDKANNASVQIMKDSEKKIKIKQDQILKSFWALLRDDEY